MSMSKKIIIPILVVLFLTIIAGGVFWWQEKEIKGSPEDYVIKETEEGTIVENKKAGLTFKIPEGWIEKNIEIEGGPIGFYSPDTEGYHSTRISPPLKKGCLIEVATAYDLKFKKLDELRKELEKEHESLITKSDEFEIIEIDGMPALKNKFDSVDLGPSIGVYVINKDSNKLYGIAVSSEAQNTERCFQEFDKFLETVSIK